MCDCYEGECEGCGLPISIHIADFSTRRDCVAAWCPACHAVFYRKMRAIAEETVKLGGNSSWRIVTDQVKTKGQAGSHSSGTVVFLILMPHGIRLN